MKDINYFFNFNNNKLVCNIINFSLEIYHFKIIKLVYIILKYLKILFLLKFKNIKINK